MDFENLETFVILADKKSFTKTAEYLHVVQSTVSSRIRELEDQVGKPLFHRTNKTVQLTNAGKYFLPYATRMIRIMNEVRENIHLMDTFQGTLHIGTYDSCFTNFIQKMTQTFMENNKHIATKLMINHSTEIVQYMHDGLIDIGYVSFPVKSSKFICKEFSSDDIILVCNPTLDSYPDGITVNELRSLPIICSDLGGDFYEWLFTIFPKDFTFQMNIDMINSQIPYLSSGYGYGFITRGSIVHELDRGQLVEIRLLDATPPTLKNYCVIDKKKMSSVSLKAWMDWHKIEI